MAARGGTFKTPSATFTATCASVRSRRDDHGIAGEFGACEHAWCLQASLSRWIHKTFEGQSTTGLVGIGESLHLQFRDTHRNVLNPFGSKYATVTWPHISQSGFESIFNKRICQQSVSQA